MAASTTSDRTRVALTVALVLLLLLLVALVVVFLKLLQPKGPPAGRSSETSLQWVRSLYGFGPAADQQLLSPSSVAVAPNGDIYATDPIRSRVMVFRPDGTFRHLLHTGGGGTSVGKFVRPESLAAALNGDVYVADSQANKIIVFDGAGTFLREWPVDSQPRGVAVDGDRVYVLGVGRVIVYDREGAQLRSFGRRGPASGEIDAYQGIAARDGRVYIADSYNARLQAFDESGTVVWSVPATASPSTSLEGDGSGSPGLSGHRWELPQDLAFDARGRLLVVDAFGFEIAVVDPKDGKALYSYGGFGRNDGEFFYPTSVAYDAGRDWVVVADTQNNRVQIVRLPGTAAATPATAIRQAVSSPYRYLVIPGLLVLFVVVFAAWTARRLGAPE